MQLEQTSAHLDARLRASGLGRLGSAGFLGIWLIFWAIGEVFVLWFVGVGAWSLLTGNPPSPGRTPLSAGVALPVGLFLLFWLALWTVGGLAAAHEFLRLLFGRDRILAESSALLVVHSYGLFRTRHQVTREHLHRFYQLPSKTALMVETMQGGMEVTRLGTADERDELAQSLNNLFSLRAEPATEGSFPAGWCEGLSPEHSSVLMPDPNRRRRAAIAVWLLFGLFSAVTLYVISAAVTQPTLWAVGLMLSAVATASGWGALWLTLGRNEWKLDRSRLVLQRRFGTNCKSLFTAESLELLENNSGEGEPSYELTAVAEDAPTSTHFYNSRKHRRVIHSQTGDPTEPRNFGLWLSRRCGLPFLDLTTPESKAKKMSELLEQLANSGRLGRAASRLIGRRNSPG